jgi:hypothetical protein
MKHAKSGRIGNTEGNTAPGGMIGLQQACSIKERFSYIHNAPWRYDSEFATGRNLYGFHMSYNGKYMYVCSGTYVHRRPLSTPYDVSTAGAEDQSLYTDDWGEGVTYSIEFSPDGTSFLLGGRESNSVYQFYCMIPWSIDLTQIRFANKRITDITNESQPRAIEMSSDGTKMYIAGYADRVVQCTLNSAFNPETKTSEYNKTFSSTNHNTITDIRGLAWKPDGTKIYLLSDGYNDVLEYTVSTAWDLSSTVTFSYEFFVGSQASYPTGMEFKPDGTKFWMTYAGNIYEYELTTAWDLSTASYSTYVVSGLSNITGMAFNDTGLQLVLTTSGTTNDMLNVYSLTSGWNVTGTRTHLWNHNLYYASTGGPWNTYAGINGTRIDTIYDPSDVYVTDDYVFITDGYSTYLGVHRFDLVESNELRSFNTGTLSYPNTNHHSEVSDPMSTYRYPMACKWSGDGRYLMIADLGVDYVLHYETNYPFILSRTTNTTHHIKYLGYTDVDYVDSNPWDMYVAPNGTTFALAGNGEDVFGGWEINTPYQPLNSRPAVGKYFHHDYAGFDDGNPTVLSFSSDGMYMYTGGYDNDKIFQYKVNQ